jgi:uncharacterized iron-regulated protein
MVKQRVRVKRVGENHHNARYTDHEVELLRQLHEQGLGYRRLSAKMEMPIRTIRDILAYRRR